LCVMHCREADGELLPSLRRERPAAGGARLDKRVTCDTDRHSFGTTCSAGARPRHLHGAGLLGHRERGSMAGSPISRHCQDGRANPMRRLAAAIDGSLCRWRDDLAVPASRCGGVGDDSAPVTHQDQGTGRLSSTWPLTHTASQKRIGRTSACPIGRCTVLVAHRPVAGVQPLVARALVAES
jgi:hypothetical protein